MVAKSREVWQGAKRRYIGRQELRKEEYGFCKRRAEIKLENGLSGTEIVCMFLNSAEDDSGTWNARSFIKERLKAAFWSTRQKYSYEIG